MSEALEVNSLDPVLNSLLLALQLDETAETEKVGGGRRPRVSVIVRPPWRRGGGGGEGRWANFMNCCSQMVTMDPREFVVIMHARIP